MASTYRIEDLKAEIDPLIIMKKVADYYHVPIEKIVLTSQKMNVVRARQQSAYFMKIFTNLTLVEIGTYFFGRSSTGMKNHASIIHEIQAVKNDMLSNKYYKAEIENIDRKLREDFSIVWEEKKSTISEAEMNLIKQVQELKTENCELKNENSELRGIIYGMKLNRRKKNVDFSPEVDVNCNCMRILGNQTLN